ncbi:alanine racemase [Uliginosibacterium sp. H1]|uniref:alanine racemase n=1 Tax=Uliginosibacterium sp. H1 TaxID=3114757 RepID=UPI002E19E8B7|nr:alanine racemase [Uliginosibacterium sp. H1]
MSRPVLARIAPGAFRHNYLLARQRSGGARAWVVVKADAYGHGMQACVAAVRDVADGYALLEHEAAVALREAGVTQPVLRLEGAFSGAETQAAAQLGLTLVVHSPAQVAMIEQSALGAPLDVYFKINTGMNRLGFAPAEAAAALARLRSSGKLGRITLATHFATADVEAGIDAQLDCFRRVATQLDPAGQLPRSLANSAALLRFPAAHADWVRPGIMLYGGSPMPGLQSAQALGLRPVMTLTSRLIGVQQVQAGERVGYGGTFTAPQAMRIGVVACGYADGYPRHAGTGTPVMVDGQRSRTLGRVSMDMLAVDLTDLPDAGVDTPVTLWGEGMDADEVATAAGTISYELFCALAPRVPREVV